ncbi:MAG: RNA methyltransferase [Ahrensia sp.]
MRIDISDADDPAIAAYRDVRERDLVRRDGLFIAEGKSVLAVLGAQSRFALHSVLVLENRLGSIEGILVRLAPDVPVYIVNRQVMDAIAGFPMHRGILALARKPDTTTPALDTSQWRRVVALSAIANHDNMGAIFRNAAAFGADAVLLDPQCCDPLYRKAIRVSVGGVLKVPFRIFETTDAMLDWLYAENFETVGLSPSAPQSVHNWKPAPKTALLMGAEGPGLSPQTLARVTGLSIPMAPGFDSLNVATATGIALAHVFHADNSTG